MYKYEVEVVSVYDGDTFRGYLQVGFGDVKQGLRAKGVGFRLYGIDTAEVRGKEKEEGKATRDHVRALMPNGSKVYIESKKDESGKYGRYLAEVYIPETGLPESFDKTYTKRIDFDAGNGKTVKCLWLNDYLLDMGMAELEIY